MQAILCTCEQAPAQPEGKLSVAVPRVYKATMTISSCVERRSGAHQPEQHNWMQTPGTADVLAGVRKSLLVVQFCRHV